MHERNPTVQSADGFLLCAGCTETDRRQYLSIRRLNFYALFELTVGSRFARKTIAYALFLCASVSVITVFCKVLRLPGFDDLGSSG